ncbi:MAG: hypothetical protein FJX76_13795 [Armatimonadetes bacterium]|nr:hypothetical protein [Armatimonadota bacterium]
MRLVVARNHGWPNGAGRWLLGLGLAIILGTLVIHAPHEAQPAGTPRVNTLIYWLRFGVMTLLASAMLLLWRRGVILDKSAMTVTRWWGFAAPAGPIVVRETNPRSLRDFTGMRVVRSGEADHYKSWRGEMYHVQLEKSESVAGQWCLRERIIVDDEYSRATDAAEAGRPLAEFLDVELILATR